MNSSDTELILESIPFFMRAISHGKHLKHGHSGARRRTQFRVLKAMEKHPGLSLSDLATRVDMEKGSISPVVNDFVERGYCRRERDRNDRRLYRLFVAPEGRSFMDNHLDGIAQCVEERLACVSEEDREEMRNALKTLRSIAEKIID